MDGKTNKLLKQIIADPATNVNQLNMLLPALIAGFSKSPQQVSEAFGSLINAMLKVKIIDLKDIERLIMGEKISDDAKESKKFVITRL
jgi:hypothetical protein